MAAGAINAQLDAALSAARFGTDVRPGDGGDSDVAAVAKQFEAVLLKQVVTAMRATIGGDSDENQLAGHLIEDAMATHLAKSGGIGLAALLAPDTAPSAASPLRGDAGRGITAHDFAVPASVGDAPPLRGGADRGALTSTTEVSPGSSLANDLPPQVDPWLGREDAAEVLERLIRFAPDGGENGAAQKNFLGSSDGSR